LIENAATSKYSKFILHYNFPPSSTGEVKMMRGPGRREVGHGNLAMRSLKQMMPGSDYAYTVRVESDILESNGSSSMATVCAGSGTSASAFRKSHAASLMATLCSGAVALMTAGVTMPKRVSDVAMGRISPRSGVKWAVLTYILIDEDHIGYMDFNVTSIRKG